MARKGQKNPIWKALKRQMIPETLSWAESLTLHNNIRGLMRDEDEREFESDPSSCLLLVKNVGAVHLLLGWCSGVCAWRCYPVLPHSSQTVTGKTAIAWDSATGGEGMSAGPGLPRQVPTLQRAGVRRGEHLSSHDPALLSERVKPCFIFTVLLFCTLGLRWGWVMELGSAVGGQKQWGSLFHSQKLLS